ncbi:unnamed protein product [Linum trigynum]|uniref:RNase H type-1 domain-containing protein n=1 Tax=Linum trigynum TaxID=586398 RepID=A0AAV2GKH4_9ROSI
MVTWKPPPRGWMCLNSDGSVSAGNAAGFYRNLGGGTVTRAELAGVTFGLQTAWRLGFRKEVAQVDSAVAIQLIKEGRDCHPYFVLVNQIRGLLARDWEVDLQHVLVNQIKAGVF